MYLSMKTTNPALRLTASKEDSISFRALPLTPSIASPALESTDSALFFTSGHFEPLRGKCMYILRTCDGPVDLDVHDDGAVIMGELLQPSQLLTSKSSTCALEESEGAGPP